MNQILKIATWNIGGAHTINSTDKFDYDREDLAYFADILRPLDLDIICLQELHTKDGSVVSKRLAHMLGLQFVFDSPRSPSHIDESYQLANAIISRYPIEDTKHILLPDPAFELYFQDGRKARQFHTYVQVVRIQGITFANTHLQPLHLFDHSWGEGEGRKLAFDTETVFLENLGEPLVFAGDFNAPELQKDFARLLKTFQLTPALDAQPTDIKGMRMDYILYSPDFTLAKSEVIKTSKSDHYLGWVKLIVR